MVETKHKRPATSRVHPDAVMPASPQSKSEIEVAELPEEMATGIVASGHTVHLNSNKVQRGWDSVLSQPVYRQEFVVAGPGEQVTLPVTEIARLQSAGVLVDPDRVIADDITTH